MKRRIFTILVCAMPISAVMYFTGVPAVLSQVSAVRWIVSAVVPLGAGSSYGDIVGIVYAPNPSIPDADPNDPNDCLGLPLTGINAVSDGVIVSTTVTGLDGNYAIQGLPIGEYSLQAVPPATGSVQTFAAKSVTGVVVQANQQTTQNILGLVPEGRVAGAVRDIGGLAVSTASVSLNLPDGIILSAATDNYGNYTIKNVPAGTYTVEAFALGFEFASVQASVAQGQTTQNVDFPAISGQVGSSSIKGRVAIEDPNFQDPNDYPAAEESWVMGYLLTEQGEGEEGGGAGGDRSGGTALRTGRGTSISVSPGLDLADEGGYGLHGMPPGRYDILFKTPGYAAKMVRDVQLGSNQEFRLNLVPDEREAVVVGRVTDSTGTAIRNAAVTIDCGDGLVLSERTDSSGNYTVKNLPSGTHEIRVGALSPEGRYVSFETGTVSVSEGQTFTHDANAIPHGQISGRVTRWDSTGIAGIRVTAVFDPNTAFSATTDSNGDYLIEEVRAGTLKVSAFDPNRDYSFTDCNVVVAANVTTEHVDFVAPAVGTIVGTVSNWASQPMPGAMVLADCGDPNKLRSGTAGSNGAYTIRDVPVGTYKLTALDANSPYSFNEYEGVQVQAGAVTNPPLNFAAVGAGHITGYVRDASGSPVIGARVAVDVGTDSSRSGFSGQDGVYKIENVPPGTHVVRATATKFEFPDRTDVTVQIGAWTQGIDFQASSGTVGTGSIVGRIAIEDPNFQDPNAWAPVPSAYVIATLPGEGPNTRPQRVGSKMANEQGSYAIQQLDAGTYTVSIRPPGYAEVIQSGVVVSAGQQTVLNVGVSAVEATISGTITDESGAPIADVTVGGDSGSGLGFTGSTDANGLYTVRCLPAGTYKVRVCSSGLTFADRTNVQVAAGAAVAGIDFSAAPWGIVSGKLTEADGTTPIPQATIRIADPCDANTLRFGETATDGNYVVRNLQPGSNYTVKASLNSEELASVANISVTAGQTTGNVNLSVPGGSISGTVSPAISGAQITVLTMGVSRSVTTSTGGGYTLPRLPAGTYTLTAVADGYIGRTLHDVELTANQQLTGKDFTLRVEGIITGQVTDGTNPVAGAMIIAVDPCQVQNDPNLFVSLEPVITDASGNYTVRHLTSGTYVVTVTRAGYVGDGNANVAVTEGQTTSNVNFTISTTGGGTISGHVTDNATPPNPIQGAVVMCASPGLPGKFAITNQQGEYQLELLKPATYTVSTSTTGFAGQAATGVAVLQGATTTQDFALTPD